MTMTPPTIETIVGASHRAADASHGDKRTVMADAAAAIGKSIATAYRLRRKLSVQPERRRRCDAGSTGLSLDDARAISALLMESHRKNGKQLMTVEHAVQVLRTEGVIRAETADAATGELRPLSASAVSRGLRVHNLHPQQLLQPKPATELQSLHPNHVWQIDASLCVLYYLRSGSPRERGLQVLDADKFYKNKPAALARVENERVWRYVVTDHFSGSLFVHYVLGAESGRNLADSFVAAISPREVQGQRDPFHGVPFIVMMDMGSANTGALFKSLARRLQVRTIAHAPGNARATGQVEKAQDIVERQFESSLKLRPLDTLEELNEAGSMWSRWFNATAVHTRHGQARTDVWLRIAADQLRLAPPVEVCQALMTHAPAERKVSPTLTVQFEGREYDVRSVPEVLVGQKLLVAVNPYRDDEISVVLYDDGGDEILHGAPLVARNEAGFREDAPVIGERYARPADTPADTNRKAVERSIMGVATDAEAEAARKVQALPFGGRIDPLRAAREAELPTAIPKRGEALALTTRAAPIEPERLTGTEAMLRIVAAIRRSLTPEEHAFMAARYAEGVPEDQIDALIAQFLALPADDKQQAAGGLRSV